MSITPEQAGFTSLAASCIHKHIDLEEGEKAMLFAQLHIVLHGKAPEEWQLDAGVNKDTGYRERLTSLIEKDIIDMGSELKHGWAVRPSIKTMATIGFEFWSKMNGDRPVLVGLEEVYDLCFGQVLLMNQALGEQGAPVDLSMASKPLFKGRHMTYKEAIDDLQEKRLVDIGTDPEHPDLIGVRLNDRGGAWLMASSFVNVMASKII